VTVRHSLQLSQNVVRLAKPSCEDGSTDTVRSIAIALRRACPRYYGSVGSEASGFACGRCGRCPRTPNGTFVARVARQERLGRVDAVEPPLIRRASRVRRAANGCEARPRVLTKTSALARPVWPRVQTETVLRSGTIIHRGVQRGPTRARLVVARVRCGSMLSARVRSQSRQNAHRFACSVRASVLGCVPHSV
jgi:hypothetical protein